MSLNAATIEILLAKGLSGADILEVARATEVKADRTNAERQARHRARRKSNTVTVTGAPPNEVSSNPRDPSEPKGSSGSRRQPFAPPTGVPEPIWSDFLASPKRRKAGMNATAYSGIVHSLNNLAEHGFPPGDMIKLAVERGWTTVKLEWVQEQANGRSGTNGMGRNQSGEARIVGAGRSFVARGATGPPG
jgi:hypothetical protein